MATIIIVIACLIVGVSSVFWTKKDHNPFEKAAEEILENQLDLPKDSVDLDIHDYMRKQNFNDANKKN